MSIPSLFAMGSAVAASTTVTPGLPAGVAATDLCVLMVGSGEADESVPQVPEGWLYAGSESGGTGTFGVGTGPRRLSFFVKQMVTGDVAPIVTLSGGVLTAQIFGLRKNASESWSVVSPVFGTEGTSGTSWSQALVAIPSRIQTDAFVIIGFVTPVASGQSFSAEGVTATGVTFGTMTERIDNGTGSTNHVRLAAASGVVAAGTPSAAPVLTATAAVASTGEVGMLVILATTATLSAEVDYSGQPLATNRVSNPSAEAQVTTGWAIFQSVGSGALTIVHALEEGIGLTPTPGVGPYAFKVTGAATNTSQLGISQALPLKVPEGASVTVSFDLYVPAGSPVDTYSVAFRDDTQGNTFGTFALGAVTAGWKRYVTTQTVAAGFNLERVYLYTVDAGAARGADSIYFDNVCISIADATGVYFDGDTNLEGYAYRWGSTPRLSESYRYLVSSPPRIGVTLTNWANDLETTVYRVHANGDRVEVRGGVLTPSGGAAFVWDYEFPMNEEVYYQADDSGTIRTTETIDEVTLRRNNCDNPAMYVDMTHWAAGVGGTGGTAVIARQTANGPVIEGIQRNFGRMTFSAVGSGVATDTGPVFGTTGSQYLPAVAGPYVMSMWFRDSMGQRTRRLVVTFYDSGGAAIGSSQTGATVASGGLWVQATISGTAPVGTDRAVVRAYANAATPALTTTEACDVTCLLAQFGGIASYVYFDGNTRGTGYRWVGTSGASASEQYVLDVPTPQIVSSTRAWLRSPGLPGLDIPVRVSVVPERAYARPVTYLAPLGRTTLVPQAGARQAPAYNLELVTLTDADADALIAFMQDTAIAWLVHPGTRIDGTYVSLGDLSEKPNPKVGMTEARWTAAATVVARPAGGVAYDPSASWQTLRDTSSSWQAVLNTYASWLDVLRGPGL